MLALDQQWDERLGRADPLQSLSPDPMGPAWAKMHRSHQVESLPVPSSYGPLVTICGLGSARPQPF